MYMTSLVRESEIKDLGVSGHMAVHTQFCMDISVFYTATVCTCMLCESRVYMMIWS